MWVKGRQGTGYHKNLLAQGSNWDLYLIFYPKGTFIPTHTDPVEGKRHYRANLVLWGPDSFGGKAIVRLPRFAFFRPDITPHSVRKVVGGSRMVLSFGFVLDK
jgi:hypothetical protein